MAPRILIYLLRRDLRLSDNPILHDLSRSLSQAHQPFTHLLPLYVFPSHQIETSGFLTADQKSPYPEARSQVGGFWRCGQHRVKFLAESVWDLKNHLERNGSGLCIRVGMLGDVVKQMLDEWKSEEGEVASVWMTEEPGVEEKREERDVRRVVEGKGKEFKLWKDEKYFVDDRDLPFQRPKDLPDIFTSFKNKVEPLRQAPRSVLPTPDKLPAYPPTSNIPPQFAPFSIPSSLTLDTLIETLHKPLSPTLDLEHPPRKPGRDVKTAHPFHGGETDAHNRVKHYIQSGSATTYKDTRNGMLGQDFSTKFSAWLALGCITARQIHSYLLDFEDGKTDLGKGAQGYGKGENKGTGWIRFELLWRDYMRLCCGKFGPRLFRESGFRADDSIKWSYDKGTLARILEGSTGTGLIDASQRELYHTGYTSNRARQNVASFLAKHMSLDWRLGAEWYECCLIDYDVASNWGNWQYNAGVGNDPRQGGGGRMFNPVKQAADYDGNAEYVKAWCPETEKLSVEEAFQRWKVSESRRKEVGLGGDLGTEQPLKKINFNVRGGDRGGRGGGDRRGGRGGKGRGKGRDGFSKRDMQ